MALVEDRASAGIDLVQADASQVTETRESLQLAVGGEEIVASKQYTIRNPDGTMVWYGLLSPQANVYPRLRNWGTAEIADDPMNSVMIVRNGNKLTGTIRKEGQLYALRPLRSGKHALVRIDESRMPADHPNSYSLLPTIPMAPAVMASGAPTIQAISTIRVMVVMTQSAINAVGDASGLINLAVAETNQGYANSGVDISLQLAGAYSTSYKESGSFSTDLSRFRGTSDGHMDSFHSTRDSISADVGVLIINNSSSCGLASGIGSTASTAFAAVHHGCATGYYSFGHEIGHLQSARHDPAADPSTTPYAYGHGYRYDSGGWRTIMAYACPSGCTRINYWSNPAKTYGGAAMGTTSTHHNQRVLNNTKATIAAFR
ncbi:zinc-dependent metalloprotease [Luteimonas vadosa]|uniref:Zinc-dependent metalloprotease n=2 Tax=Luteimonas vadosa TaxID=1165507 RepID=A0ABP9DVJ3_9GAMM